MKSSQTTLMVTATIILAISLMISVFAKEPTNGLLGLIIVMQYLQLVKPNQ